MIDAEEEAKAILDVPLDCFGGADGGSDFIGLRTFLAEMIERSNNGDEGADKLVTIAKQYSKMILVANGKN